MRCLGHSAGASSVPVREGVREASMPASPSNAGSQLDATQFHPEFGYLAPTLRFRRKFALLIEGVAGGVLVGAVAMFFATMEREEKALAMLATPMLVTPVTPIATPASAPTASAPAAIASTPAAVSPPAAAPPASRPAVSKTGSPTPAPVASTLPQTAAVRGFTPVRFVPESMALPVATREFPPVLSELRPTLVDGAPAAAAPQVKAAVAKPKKKIVREPQPERTAGQVPPEPEPRTAYASRPQPPAFLRSLFGLGN